MNDYLEGLSNLGRRRTHSPRMYGNLIKKHTSDWIFAGKIYFSYSNPEEVHEMIVSFLTFAAVNSRYYLMQEEAAASFAEDFMASVSITNLNTTVYKYKLPKIVNCLMKLRKMVGISNKDSRLNDTYTRMLEKFTKNGRKSLEKASWFIGYRIGEGEARYEFKKFTRSHYNFINSLLANLNNDDNHESVNNFRQLLEYFEQKLQTDYTSLDESKQDDSDLDETRGDIASSRIFEQDFLINFDELLNPEKRFSETYPIPLETAKCDWLSSSIDSHSGSLK